MDMHIPQALLRAAEPARPYPQPTADSSQYCFSDQLTARYDADTRALWICWTPTPRPSFNPELLRALDRCAQFIRAGEGFIPRDDSPAESSPIEYTVLASEVRGV